MFTAVGFHRERLSPEGSAPDARPLLLHAGGAESDQGHSACWPSGSSESHLEIQMLLQTYFQNCSCKVQAYLLKKKKLTFFQYVDVD